MAKRSGNRVFGALLVLVLAGGLAGWGTRAVQTGRVSSVGTVGGLPITTRDYGDALTRQLKSLQQQLGQPVTMEQARAFGLNLDQQVLGGLVTQRTLDVQSIALGLSVNDARVAEAVRTTPGFQGLSGEFDRAAYRDQLHRIGLSETQYEDGLRADSARAILQAAILTGLPEPVTAAQTLAAWKGERRTVTWAELPSAVAAQTLPGVTDVELKAWYDAHPERYTAPEVRHLTYAWVTPEMIQDKLTVADADVRDLYDTRADQFVQPERRLVERLAFGDQASADEARVRLDAGTIDFEALVAERGLALSDIDMGDVAKGDLGAAGDAVFAAKPGDVVGPLATDLGPAILRVNAVLAATTTPFEAAAPDLRAELANTAARRAIGDEIAKLQDLVAGGANVEDVVKTTDLTLGTLDWSEGVTTGPAAYDEFRNEAASAEVGALPKVVELQDGGAFVLRLDGITPPTLRPFEEVATQVATDQRADALATATLADAQRKAEAIAAGASFEEQGLTPRTEAPRIRVDVIEGAPQGTVGAAFGLAPGAATALPSPGGAIVLRLDAVAPAPADDPGVAADRTSIAQSVSSAEARDLFDAFARQLRAQTDVTLDDAAAQSVASQIK